MLTTFCSKNSSSSILELSDEQRFKISGGARGYSQRYCSQVGIQGTIYGQGLIIEILLLGREQKGQYMARGYTQRYCSQVGNTRGNTLLGVINRDIAIRQGIQGTIHCLGLLIEMLLLGREFKGQFSQGLFIEIQLLGREHKEQYTARGS